MTFPLALAVLPVGRNHEMLPVAPVRTEAQRRTVAAIIVSDDFDFACNNPFTSGVGDYTGPFTFLWYTTDGALHARRISKTGRTLHEVKA